MNDRRKVERSNIEVDVTIGDVKGIIGNLSMGGALCFLDDKVPTMETLPVEFTVDGFTIKMQGTALRCEEITKGNFSTGVYFNTPSMTGSIRTHLGLFLEKLRNKSRGKSL